MKKLFYIILIIALVLGATNISMAADDEFSFSGIDVTVSSGFAVGVDGTGETHTRKDITIAFTSFDQFVMGLAENTFGMTEADFASLPMDGLVVNVSDISWAIVPAGEITELFKDEKSHLGGTYSNCTLRYKIYSREISGAIYSRNGDKLFDVSISFSHEICAYVSLDGDTAIDTDFGDSIRLNGMDMCSAISVSFPMEVYANAEFGTATQGKLEINSRVAPYENYILALFDIQSRKVYSLDGRLLGESKTDSIQLTPTSSTYSTSYKNSKLIPGDVDFDGDITAADASRILRGITKYECLDCAALHVADFNGDGDITAADASSILKYIVRIFD